MTYTESRDALENDIRELRGAKPAEMARRLIERGWLQTGSEREAGPFRWYDEKTDRYVISADEYDRLATGASRDGLREAAEQAFHWFVMSAGEYHAHYGHNDEPIDALRAALSESEGADR